MNIPVEAKTYYDIREKNWKEKDSFTRATYFFYLNRNCFNGLYRTNLKGHFNVPFSGKKTTTPISLNNFLEYATVIEKAHFTVGDFTEIIKKWATPNSFIFLDPPYVNPGTRAFKEYSHNSFGINDMPRFIEILNFIDDLGAKFLFTYDERQLTSLYLRDTWNVDNYTVRRNISGFASHRKLANEVAIYNGGLNVKSSVVQ